MELRPQGLIAYRQFIVYELRNRKGTEGKKDKVPVDPVTLRNTNHLDDKAWMDFDTANAHANRLGAGYDVGFVFTEKDPFFFIDIDNAYHDDKWSDVATNLYASYPGAYTEVSASERGLHIIGSYSVIPEHVNKGKPGSGLELYFHGRFVALTGTHGTGNALTDCTAALAVTAREHFAPRTGDKPGTATGVLTSEPCEGWRGHTDDDALIQHALRMKDASVFTGKALFRDLWENNTTVLAKNYSKSDGNIDDSTVDIALAGFLAWMTGKDGERVLRLMKQSKLVREKWKREDGYLIPTIIKACDSCTSPPFVLPEVRQEGVEPGNPVARKADGFSSIEHQKTLFKDCTYIQDHNGILIPGGEILTQDQFRVMYGGFKFTIDLVDRSPTTKNAWEAFTQNRVYLFPRAHRTCFRPDLAFGTRVNIEGRDAVNLYVPRGIVRVKGDDSLFREFLSKIFASERDLAVFMAFAASCVQNPGVKFTWAPYLQGTEGNGKSILVGCIMHAIGLVYCHIVRSEDLGGRFNGWIDNKQVILVDDFFDPHGEKLEIIKPMITGERMEVEEKNKNKRMADICANFFFTSNFKDGIRITENTRRFAPLYTRQQTAADLVRDGLTQAFFDEFGPWLKKHNGYGIVANTLDNWPIPPDLDPAGICNRAPATSSTQDAYLQSITPVAAEVQEAVDQGAPGFRGGWIDSASLADLLTRARMVSKCPRKGRRKLLLEMGYVPHPNLDDGRATSDVMTPLGKSRPRLYIKRDHPDCGLTGTAIPSAYEKAQIL
jgi:hypothetical protein